jgi:hypothetical protein
MTGRDKAQIRLKSGLVTSRSRKRGKIRSNRDTVMLRAYQRLRSGLSLVSKFATEEFLVNE